MMKSFHDSIPLSGISSSTLSLSTLFTLISLLTFPPLQSDSSFEIHDFRCSVLSVVLVCFSNKHHSGLVQQKSEFLEFMAETKTQSPLWRKDCYRWLLLVLGSRIFHVVNPWTKVGPSNSPPWKVETTQVIIYIWFFIYLFFLLKFWILQFNRHFQGLLPSSFGRY